jgi:soluble cytochrome b562
MVQLLISKMQQQQIEWRRDRVLELSSQGFNQSDIAFALHVNKSIISRDMAYLNHKAQDTLQHHIHEIILTEWQKAMNSLNQVLRLTWAIVSKTPDEKTRLQALTLITEVNKYKNDLATDGTYVKDYLNTFQGKVERLNKNKQAMEEKSIAGAEAEAQTESETKDKTTNTVF